MTIARRKRVALLVALLVVVAVSAGAVLASSKLRARGGVDDWRPFDMVYRVPGASIAIGQQAQSQSIETVLLEYRSSSSWKATVIEAEPVKTAVGEFSRRGSYVQVEGRTKTEYDSVVGRTTAEQIPGDVATEVAHPVFARVPPEVIAGTATSRRASDLPVRQCDFDGHCSTSTQSIIFIVEGQELAFTNDDQRLPLRRGSFEAVEIRSK